MAVARHNKVANRMPIHIEGAVAPAAACPAKVSQRKAPGAISAIAFIVRPVKPTVDFISAEFSAISVLLCFDSDCRASDARAVVGFRQLPGALHAAKPPDQSDRGRVLSIAKYSLRRGQERPLVGKIASPLVAHQKVVRKVVVISKGSFLQRLGETAEQSTAVGEILGASSERHFLR